MVPGESREAKWNLVHARPAAVETQSVHRQQVSSFMLTHGRVFARPKAWIMRCMRWLQRDFLTRNTGQPLRGMIVFRNDCDLSPAPNPMGHRFRCSTLHGCGAHVVRICHDYEIALFAPSSNMMTFFRKLERAMGFEPTTPTLARLCSTPELRPRLQGPAVARARGIIARPRAFASARAMARG